MQRSLRYLFWMCFVLLLHASQQALGQQPTVVLSAEKNVYEVLGESAYYEDKDRKLGIEAISQEDFQANFVPSPKEEKLNFGYTNSVYWVRFTVRNNTKEINDWVLTCEYAALDYLSLYYQDPQSGKWIVQKSGDLYDFDKRDFSQRYPLFALSLPAGMQRTYFMRVETAGSYQIPLKVYTLKALYEQDVQAEVAYGLYYGIMLVMAFYNLFLFFSLRDLNYLYYFIAIAGNFLFFATLNGHSQQYLWPDATQWGGAYAILFAMGTLGFGSAMFAHSFLTLPKYSKFLAYVLRGVMVASLLIIVFNFFVPYRILGKTASFVLGINAIFIVISSWFTWLKGNTVARFFCIAWTFYLLGGLLLIFRTFGLIPTNFFTVHAVEIGSSLEVILLSLALSDRYNLFKKEKEAAQKRALELEKQTTEKLEKMVEVRTKEIQKQSEEISAQNEELAQQADFVNEINTELASKNDLLERTNLAITSSINYAKRIQEAMLPARARIRKHLPDSFIFFRPRDIVSGDFYWFAEQEDYIYIAAVDCTGHGVPGAFMSLIGHSLLNNILQTKDVSTPAQILQHLKKDVVTVLKQEQMENNDGMDLGLCRIDRKNQTLLFAGAKHSMIQVVAETGEMIVHEGNNIMIGGVYENPRETAFINRTVRLEQHSTFFLFSDGYQDQFGGEKGRKFMRKRFRRLLSSIGQKPIEAQVQELETTFDDWKSTHAQIDDVLVIGFQV